MPAERRGPRRLLRIGLADTTRVADILRTETIGGLLLVVAAIAALLWSNWPGGSDYQDFVTTRFGPATLQLNLTVGEWAADGLLAIFFFVAGLEVKHEFTAGDLRTPARAVVPVLAAVGGMAVPALLYLAVNAGGDTHALRGWAIPSATDIAFALAVLALVSTHLPTALRTFLLTLAVVDDLLAIVIIALFFTTDLDLLQLLFGCIPLAVFGILVRRKITTPWLLVPLALATWGFVHASGVHATVAGVALALTVPARSAAGQMVSEHAGSGRSVGPELRASQLAHRLRPVSAGLAVPVFALCSAGVAVGGWSGLSDAIGNRVAIGIIVGLIVGKAIGIFATTYALASFTEASLDDDLRWGDIAGVAVLGGVGFTVSILLSELAFGQGSPRDDHAKVAVLLGSLLAAVCAAAILHRRNRRHSGQAA